MDLTEHHTPQRPRALVVGLGVSGISTAIALHKAGWTPVVIERAPGRRRGGYFIGLFGSGRVAAERLGIMQHLHNRVPQPSVNFDIDRDGHRRPALGFADLPGTPWLMMRGDVEQAAFRALEELDGDVEIRYSTVPTAIEQDTDGVDVTLHNTADGTTTTERFDLVVGADGLRSTVRKLAFGPDKDYLQRLNYMITAFELPAELPGIPRRQGAILTEPGRSFWVFPFADHPSTVLFSYRTDDVDAEFSATPAERIRAVYGPEPLGAAMEEAVKVLENSDEHLFDSAEQVHMDSWHRGRVVLVGDSAWCVTLYAGMGVSAGVAGAELLGIMLAHYGGDLQTALTRWEDTMRPHIEKFQEMGLVNRSFFTPSNRIEKVRRDLITRLRRSPRARRVLQRFVGIEESIQVRNIDIAATAGPSPAPHAPAAA